MAATASPDTDVSTDLAAEINAIFEDKYQVIIHDDPVTTFEAVINALMTLFKHSQEDAEFLTEQVHYTGKCVAAVLSRAEAEDGVKKLHERKIQASSEKV